MDSESPNEETSSVTQRPKEDSLSGTRQKSAKKLESLSKSLKNPVRRRFLANLERRKSVQRNSASLALTGPIRNGENADEENRMQIFSPTDVSTSSSPTVSEISSKKYLPANGRRKELIDRVPIFVSRRRTCFCTTYKTSTPMWSCRCFSCQKLNNARTVKSASASLIVATPGDENRCRLHDDSSVWPRLKWSPPQSGGKSAEENLHKSDEHMRTIVGSERSKFKSETSLRLKKRFKVAAVSRRVSMFLSDGHVQRLTSFYEDKSAD